MDAPKGHDNFEGNNSEYIFVLANPGLIIILDVSKWHNNFVENKASIALSKQTWDLNWK